MEYCQTYGGLPMENKNQKTPQDGKERRDFLKKAVYAAPTLVVLGQLSKPTESEAGFGPPPSDAGFN